MSKLRVDSTKKDLDYEPRQTTFLLRNRPEIEVRCTFGPEHGSARRSARVQWMPEIVTMPAPPGDPYLGS